MYLFIVLEKVMKKLLTLFAVLALTAPVFADTGDPNVRITCDDEGGGVVAVYYELLAEDGFVPENDRMRGIALRIKTPGSSALFDAISDYAADGASVPHEATEIPQGYAIYPGSIRLSPSYDPNVADYGDPVAPSGDDGAGDDLPDAEEIVVELGSLYNEDFGGSPPPTSGLLFRLTLDANGETSTVLDIEGESTRGGDLGEAVLESGAQASIVLSVETDAYLVNFDCFTEDKATSPAKYAAEKAQWELQGKPGHWCCPHHIHGDANGDGKITTSDYLKLRLAFGAEFGDGSGKYDCRADFNHDGRITSSDYLKLRLNFGKDWTPDGVCPPQWKNDCGYGSDPPP